MKLRFLIFESLQALYSNLLRSLLTIIGIVVGIFSVTAMLALGAGLSQNVLERFSSFANGDLTVTGDINYTDYDWVASQPYVSHALASMSVGGTDVIMFGSDFSPSVQTVVGDYSDLQSYEIVSGDTFDFNNPDFAESVVVVSDGFAAKVLEDTGRSVIDQTLTVNNQAYTVVGVIKSSSNAFTRGDGIILLPYNSVVGVLTNTKNFSSVAVLLQDSSYFEIAGQDILKSLNASRQLAFDSEDIFNIETAQAFIETAQETTNMISVFLGVVGGIALFVGGIGTMNMMLTTVTERTKEIGLRKAIGARDRDIMLQILIESVALTSLGGLLGILLSLGVAKIANSIFADSSIITILVNTQVIALAAFVAVAVGVVFGLYPARNASRLQPVDALRSE
ncbi:ABC transporter permease [Candidatus Nomurabacteria bacterium]|nr:ABC transporter permease [Candidatus Kaiserbacteria bacterium]MCB9811072.1 ABC transporter permease [Candidatus Nomurabacteria bacterium]MCB9814932.1 ABC transporter permease [Candidatus Nomurabacteria bacterium]